MWSTTSIASHILTTQNFKELSTDYYLSIYKDFFTKMYLNKKAHYIRFSNSTYLNLL